ncbi:class I SAM-dependent methyltransferase [Serinicoccus hydrothermalis]|uniref:class I SAM-dependent methyltransferase n=1 Tax=Serinicoccus hydrothermalis TaxID=1758689 RepID=UPI00082A0A82|nr:class I SAM-dependent methyltransferase [Serinicoccus hydrothermalis]
MPAPPPPETPDRVVRRAASHEESVRAGRGWWDEEAETYYAEHGRDLGDADLSWGPEGRTEAELGVLGPLRGLDVLEVGGGAAQGARWCAGQGARVLSCDVSGGMLTVAQRLDASRPGASPAAYLQCDGAALPLADACLDVVFTAHGVLAFVPDATSTLREWARVVRPGGRVVFSLPHPFRWVFPDVPGPEGLVARHSYFDRAAYVEETAAGVATYTEHHRTLGDLVRAVHDAGLVLVDLVEPTWVPGRHAWGGWSATRGDLLPGTALLVTVRPADDPDTRQGHSLVTKGS